MVDRWAAAPPASRELLFEGAYAVRQIEGAFAAMAFLVLGLTILMYGIALILDAEAPTWLGVLGLTTGLLTVSGTVAVAHSPFGELTGTMGILGFLFMIGSLLMIVWIALVASFLFRSSRTDVDDYSVAKRRVAKVGR